MPNEGFWRLDNVDEEEVKLKMDALGIHRSFFDPPPKRTNAEFLADLDAAMREAESDPEYLWLLYRLAGCEPQTKGNA